MIYSSPVRKWQYYFLPVDWQHCSDSWEEAIIEVLFGFGVDVGSGSGSGSGNGWIHTFSLSTSIETMTCLIKNYLGRFHLICCKDLMDILKIQ